MLFKSGTPSSNTEHMRIDGATGQIAMGTASPVTQSKLTLNGSLSVIGSDSDFSSGGNRVMIDHTQDAGSTVMRVGTIAGGGAATKGIWFYANSGLAMSIDAQGNMGFGTTTPAAKLDLNGNIGFSGTSSVAIGRTTAQTSPSALTIRSNVNNTGASPSSGSHIILYSGFNGGGDYGQIEYNTQSGGAAGSNSGDHIFSTGTTSLTERMRIKASGNVGIGINTPSALLHVNGTAGNNTGTWSNLSDRRLKKDIRPLENALNRVLALRGVTFYWKDPAEHGNRTGQQMGFIAQEVEQVVPEWVSELDNGYKWITPQGYRALFVEAVKELKKEKDVEIESLRTENTQLKAAFEHQQKEITALKQQQAKITDLLAQLASNPPGDSQPNKKNKHLGSSED